MKGILNKQQLDYIFFHLGYLFEINQDLKDRFRFKQKEKDSSYILFNLSEKDLDIERVQTVDSIPVLFPLSKKTQFYFFKDNNLIFEQDILKSAFYLLSGYQEWDTNQKDYYNRFPFENSIQKKLGIINKPIVNYYFEIIAKGIEEFCLIHNIPFKRKKLTDNFIFLLSHDVDLIDNYNYYEVGNKFKQVLGLSKPIYEKGKSLKIFLKYFFNWLKPFNKKNPFWCFDKLIEIEKENNINATYYFLEKDLKHKDSYYKFSDKRIKNLINKLENSNAEIGLHGTIRSADSLEAMKETLQNLQDATCQDVIGIRQHTLKYNHPETLNIQETAGIKYDTTLGFAAHEGFRNSYCLPFKLYDFDNDRMIDVWEFPLVVMDGTLFGYRKLNYDSSLQSIMQLVNEVIKFKGVFTLLWHNSFFEEIIYPEISEFYKKLIGEIVNRNPESITGRALYNKIENHIK